MMDIRDDSRLVKPFNRGWLFAYDPDSTPDTKRALPDASGTDFVPVALPHTWQTFETTREIHPFVRNPAEGDNPYWWLGWGWYRKAFRLDPRHRGRRAFLEFDGAQKVARVYCNGQLMDEHAGGFASFSVDLTAVLRWDAPNIVAVAVHAAQRDAFGGIPPMNAGNWALYGGLYREARLVLTHPVYIPFQGSASFDGGMRITTPQVSRSEANVQLITHVRNEDLTPRQVTVQHEILQRDGAVVTRLARSVELAAGASLAVEPEQVMIRQPRLWSPDDPYCYTVNTMIMEGDQMLDAWRAPLGFRWFHWDNRENALYLNDQRVRLTGMNRHQEYPWLGDAVPWWLHEQELHELRYALGVNFARWCHYPNDQRVYDWCDRHGVIVCEEVPCIKSLPFGQAHQRQQVLEMIRRDRNHPCIIMWSMGNETDNGADGRWARAEDPTRLIHYRKVQGPNPEADHTHEQLDMENLLRCTIRGWWETAAMDADTAPLPEDAANGQITGSEAWQHAAACLPDGSIRGRIDEDTVIWIYADHGADREYRNCPLKHVNPKGWVDAYRQPKAIYGLWQANRTERLMVRARAYWWRRPHIGTERDIVVDSNGDSVELWVGDRSYGHQQPTPENFHSVVYRAVRVEDQVLRVVARRGAEEVEERIPMAGPPTALRLRSSHTELEASLDSVALLTVDVVDAAGQTVVGARPTLQWSAAGPGQLLGPAHWESDINRREEHDGTMYIITPVTMPVRATTTPGNLRIIVAADRLQTAEVDIAVRVCVADPADGITEESLMAGDGQRLADQAAAARNGGVDRISQPPMVYADLVLPAGKDPEVVRARVRSLLLDTAGTAAVDALLDTLVGLALSVKGNLIADDINFHLAEWHKSRS